LKAICAAQQAHGEVERKTGILPLYESDERLSVASKWIRRDRLGRDQLPLRLE
jgi:hypothetical protein